MAVLYTFRDRQKTHPWQKMSENAPTKRRSCMNCHDMSQLTNLKSVARPVCGEAVAKHDEKEATRGLRWD